MTTLALLFALIIPSTGIGTTDPRLGNVTHCMQGEMTLKDNGMLVGADSAVDFHQLMADPEINGIPELTPIDATIKVCQSNGRLVYHVN